MGAQSISSLLFCSSGALTKKEKKKEGRKKMFTQVNQTGWMEIFIYNQINFLQYFSRVSSRGNGEAYLAHPYSPESPISMNIYSVRVFGREEVIFAYIL